MWQQVRAFLTLTLCGCSHISEHVCMGMAVIFTWGQFARRGKAKIAILVSAQGPPVPPQTFSTLTEAAGSSAIHWPNSVSPSSFSPLACQNLQCMDQYASHQTQSHIQTLVHIHMQSCRHLKFEKKKNWKIKFCDIKILTWKRKKESEF